MATQAVIGHTLRVLQKGKEWWRVQCPDGYIAWIPTSSVVKEKRRRPQGMAGGAPFHRHEPRSDPRIALPRLPTRAQRKVSGSDASCRVRRQSAAREQRTSRNRTPPTAGAAMPMPPPCAQSKSGRHRTSMPRHYSRHGGLFARRDTVSVGGTSSKKRQIVRGLAKSAMYFANGIILLRDASASQDRTPHRNATGAAARPAISSSSAMPKQAKVTHVAITTATATTYTLPVASGATASTGIGKLSDNTFPARLSALQAWKGHPASSARATIPGISTK